MTINQLLGSRDALVRLTEKHFNSYKVARGLVLLRQAIEAELKVFLELEQNSIKELSAKDEKGKPIFLADGRLQLRDEEAKELFEKRMIDARETEVDSIKPITLREEDFASPEDFPTPNDMLLLEPLVTFE